MDTANIPIACRVTKINLARVSRGSYRPGTQFPPGVPSQNHLTTRLRDPLQMLPRLCKTFPKTHVFQGTILYPTSPTIRLLWAWTKTWRRDDNCRWILWQGSLLLPGRLSEHWQCPWQFLRAAGEVCEAWGIRKRKFSGERDLAAFGLGKYLE